MPQGGEWGNWSPAPPQEPTGGCADDDATIITLAASIGLTISGCADVASFCTNPTYGTSVQPVCPVTCGSCPGQGRRLVAKVMQKIEEFSNSEYNIFYP